MDKKTLKLSTLTQWMQEIESGYAQRGIHDVDLSGCDFYHCVSTDMMFDVYAQPEGLMPIGSIVDDAQAVAGDSEHLNENGLQYFALSGDFSLSCDIRLTGWTRARILDQLLMLSNHGLRIAMLDESSDNPFDALLFEAGSTRRVTVVQNDTSNEVGLYPHGSHLAT